MAAESPRTPGPLAVTALRQVLADEFYQGLTAEELLGRYLRDRDEEAFRAVVTRFGPLVMRECRRVMGREDLAQEAFQETFHLLIVKGHAVRRRGSVGKWLTVTARRRSLNVVRRERRTAVRERVVGPRPDTPEPAAVVAAADARGTVGRVLATLPDRYRLPLELVYLDGFTHAEAAAALKWPKGTVDSYVRRGLTRMRKALERSGLPAAGGVVVGLIGPAAAVPPDWVVRTVAAAASVTPRLGGWSGVAYGLAGLTAVGLVVGVGYAVRPAPAPPPSARPETLVEQNLRLLNTVVAPRVCEALQPLALGGGTFTVAETEAYDSRVRCLIEVRHEKKLAGVGEVSRLAFFYDSYLRGTHVYFDATGTGQWKSIDLNRPLVLFAIPRLKWEWKVDLVPLQKAVAAFEALPKDPRGALEAERRHLALRARIRRYEGTWYREGDPGANARVEADLSQNMRFFRPGERSPFLTITGASVWHYEAGSRVARPKDDDGFLAFAGLFLSEDGQTLRFDLPEKPWHRTARKK